MSNSQLGKDLDRLRSKRWQAYDLRLRGWSYQEIADTVGYDSRQTARAEVQEAVRIAREERAQERAELVELEQAKLDIVEKRLYEILDREGVLVRGDQVVTLDGQPVRDDSPALQAAARLVDLQTRRAKLLGLDAATKTEATVSGHVNYSFEGVDVDEV